MPCSHSPTRATSPRHGPAMIAARTPPTRPADDRDDADHQPPRRLGQELLERVEDQRSVKPSLIAAVTVANVDAHPVHDRVDRLGEVDDDRVGEGRRVGQGAGVQDGRERPRHRAAR